MKFKRIMQGVFPGPKATAKSIPAVILLLMCLCSSACLRGQEMHPEKGSKPFYFSMSGGYGFPAAKQSFLWDNYYTLHTKPVLYSFGHGYHIDVNIGYRLMKNVYADLGISWLIRSTFNPDWQINQMGLYTGYTDVERAGLLRMVPGLRFQAGMGKLQPYTCIGFSLGIPLYLTETWTGQDATGSVLSCETSLHGRLSYGMHGSLGLLYKLNKAVDVFLEWTGYLQNWAPGKRTITKYTVDGVDKLSTLADRETVFSADYTIQTNPKAWPSAAAINGPSIQSQIYIPFSSSGFSIGLRMRFGKRFLNEGARYDL